MPKITYVTIEAITDKIKVFLVSQIPGLNEAYLKCDGDVAISIAVKVGMAADGGFGGDVDVKYTKDKVQIKGKWASHEDQVTLFEQEGAWLVENMPREEEDNTTGEKTETPAFFSPPDCIVKDPNGLSCVELPTACSQRYLCCLQCIDPCVAERCHEAKARVTA